MAGSALAAAERAGMTPSSLSKSLSDSKSMKEVERVAGEIQQTLDALESIRDLQLGNKRAGRIAYKTIGPRLAKGEITKEAARLEVGSKLTGFQVTAPKAKRLGEERVPETCNVHLFSS
jgi:hypothetical protein